MRFNILFVCLVVATIVTLVTAKSFGTVRVFYTDKNFGLIIPDDGSEDILVPYSGIKPDSKPLFEGERVEYDITKERGWRAPTATNVFVL